MNVTVKLTSQVPRFEVSYDTEAQDIGEAMAEARRKAAVIRAMRGFDVQICAFKAGETQAKPTVKPEPIYIRNGDPIPEVAAPKRREIVSEYLLYRHNQIHPNPRGGLYWRLSRETVERLLASGDWRIKGPFTVTGH